MHSNAFCDQVVIVTGASAGIGKAVALQLAQQGAKVVIAARRLDRLEQVAVECRTFGAEVVVVPTDVSEEAQCKALVEKAVAAFGRLDMLVNNAGLAASALFDEFPDLSLFRHTMDVNLYGAVYCTYFALPYLKRSKGRIVAVSSLGGKTAIPYNTPYCASKYGLHGFYDSLRIELIQHGVSITVVCPWWVATEFHAAQLTKDGLPRGASRGKDYYTAKTMSAARCAVITLQAAYKHRREVLMGPGTLAVWLKVLAPVFLEPAARRARAAQKSRGE
jgi:short-subunit dehydrogenase